MTKVLGTQLQAGVSLAYGGVEMQSATETAAGELKLYRDANGEICSVYAVDGDETECTFEGLLKTSGYTAKDVGDSVSISGAQGSGSWVVSAWEEVYSNDEVTKVRGTAHSYVLASGS